MRRTSDLRVGHGRGGGHLPSLLDKVGQIASQAGLADDPITIRISGCPNGCPRPDLAEIALVGRRRGDTTSISAPARPGTVLNALFRENIAEPEILTALDSLLRQYAAERMPGERFGDFTVRTAIVPVMADGRDFHQFQESSATHSRSGWQIQKDDWRRGQRFEPSMGF